MTKSNILPEDLDRLRHMLGAEPRYKQSSWGFRNHYAPGNEDDMKSLGRLEAAGYVQRGRMYANNRPYFHATKAGCILVGVSLANANEVAADRYRSNEPTLHEDV